MHERSETQPEGPTPARAWLPWQNLLLASVSIAAVGWAILSWNDAQGWPLGPRDCHEQGTAPWLARAWALALLWPVHLLSARFAAQWLLARAAVGRNPGLRLLLVSAALALIPQNSADVTCRRVLGWYEWSRPRYTWEGLVLDWWPGLWLGHLAALAVALPALLDKRPGATLPPVSAFGLWIGWNLLWCGVALGRVGEATFALLLAPFVVVTVWAFRRGYPTGA